MRGQVKGSKKQAFTSSLFSSIQPFMKAQRTLGLISMTLFLLHAFISSGQTNTGAAFTSQQEFGFEEVQSGQPAFIRANRAEDRLHPEFGKEKLASDPMSEEIMGMRTEYSRTFRKSDGTYATMQSYAPIHELKNGQWLSLPEGAKDAGSNTYAGEIQTDEHFDRLSRSSECPGLMTVNITNEAFITSLDVSYSMTASNDGWISEQRSQLRCTSSGGQNENSLNIININEEDTYSYSRSLNIANNVSGGGDVNFELHAGRDWGGNGCSTYYNKVDANTWTITVHYTLPNTYYSYKNGNWDALDTWTTDPSGTTLEGSAIPGQYDRAVILNGRDIDITASNKTVGIVEIRDGGNLDLTNTTGHTFSSLLGRGYLKLSTGSLPAGNMDAFVSESGGTIEFYGASDFTFNRNVFNNLILNFSNTARVATVANDFTVNGTLNILRGDFRIGNSTDNRNVYLLKDIFVESNGKISVGNNNNSGHNIYISGNLNNNGGSVRFRNNDNYTYSSNPNNGRSTVYFNNGAADQLLICNGITYFHNFIVNKGVDATYILDVQANNVNNFKVLGRNDDDISGENGSVLNNKSIDVQAGTLKLGANISIQRLLTTNNSSYSFAIDQDAMLWIDGAEVHVTNENNTSSIIIYGKLLITNNSVFSSSGTQGIILRESGSYEQSAGNTTTTVFRTSSRLELGTHRGAFIMSGGVMNITGNNYAYTHASFCLPFADNGFNMSGGEINILNSCHYGSNNNKLINHSWLVNSGTNNIVVTGGTVNIYATSRNARINGTTPFYNLNLIGNGSYTISIEANEAQKDGNNTVVPATVRMPLVVLNNLNITDRAVFNAQGQNVTIGKNFNIETNTTYTPGANTTIFNGQSTQAFNNNGTITSGLNNMSIENKAIVSISQNLNIRQTLSIAEESMLRDMGKSINVSGDILNNGTHESQAGGAIVLTSTSDQNINGNGNGIFGNLTLNKASGITTLGANASIKGNLRLAGIASIFDIGSQKLSIASTGRIYDHLTNTTSTNFSNSRMIRTSGNASDGGLKIVYSNIQERIYPLGVGNKYAPAKISFNNPPTDYGSITVRPVDYPHPHRTTTNSLDFYWSVVSDGFSGITNGNLVQKFYYDASDVHGGADINEYLPAVYNPVFWQKFSTDDVAQATREIRFNQIVSPDGDFTAGYLDAFGGVAAIFSRVSGNWGGADTWTYDPVTNTPISNYTPKFDDPVVIRAGHTVSLNINNAISGSLNIQENGILDIKTFTGHNFGANANGKVYGKGRLRISSSTATAQFPGGDFGEFLGENGGTVEYYTLGVNFTVPPVYIGTNLNENFNASTIPSSWTIINDGEEGTWNIANTGISNTNCANINTHNGGDLLVTPRLYPTEGNSNLSYYLRRHDSDARVEIWVSTTGNSYDDFIINGVKILSSTPPPNNWNTQWSEDLSDYIGQPIYIAFRSVGDDDGFRIDNVAGPSLYTESNAPFNYKHLVLNPENGRTITMGSESIRVYGDLSVQGQGTALFSNASSTSVSVDGDLLISQSATLQYPNGVAASLSIKGNTEITSTNGIIVSNAGTAVANALTFYGNIINNGKINLFNSSRYANLTFAGTENQTFSGSGTNNFYKVIVNKGSSQEPLVNITANNFSVNTALDNPISIQNGSIRFSGTSLTTTISNTSMNIPATGSLIVNGSTITLAAAANNDANLFLAGKLEVASGTLNIGNQSNTNRNDIEYPGAGQPEIVVSGGALNVNGQIRRNISLPTGSLVYKQSGGTVTIFGKNRQLTRALLEITNPGSAFEMDGGEIVLVNGVNSSTNPNFGDFYLNPENHSVTGGKIITGSSLTSSTLNYFNLHLVAPVWDLQVSGEALIYTALRSVPANINNDLLINGPAASQFRANNLTVTIGGSLISSSSNTGTSFNRGNSNDQHTIFTGRKNHSVIEKNNTFHPSITGGLSFGKLTISIEASDTLEFTGGEVWIYNSTEFNGGRIIQNNNSWIGALSNVYLSNGTKWTANGRLFALRSTTSSQSIISEGINELGFIQLRNTFGVSLQGNISISHGINFNSGTFNIGEYNVNLAPSAIISGTIDNSKMIVTNGALSDAGVTKEYATAGQFTFPIGVAGKYTPATLNVTNTGGAPGSITVKPVNAYHPATATPTGDELQYFWNVSSTGFNNPTVRHTYAYNVDDVKGNESNYIVGRYHDFQWQSPIDSIDATGHRILINQSSNVDYIDGEYTAGLEANFAEKPILYSRVSSGNWFDGNSWSINESGTPAYGQAPNGNPVVIKEGHAITINNNGAYANSVDIKSGAKLILGQTYQHYLGHVNGDGTINLTSTTDGSFIFPGGNYTDFMNSDISTIEYVGNGTLPAAITTYSNVKFMGGGTTKKIPAIDIIVRGNLTIEQGYLDNYSFNRNITVGGTWTSNTTSGFIAGKGKVTFNGTNSQITSKDGENFYNLQINQVNGKLTLGSPVNVSHILYLTNGIIYTSTINSNILSLTSTATSVVSGGSNNSFVQGPLRKLISTGSYFDFPVGDTNTEGTKRIGKSRVFGTITTGNQYWTSQYHFKEPENRLSLNAPLQAVSTNEYWEISGPTGAQANIRLRWDNLSEPVPATVLGRQKMRVARYIPSLWHSIGQTITDGGVTNGTVQTAATVTFGSTPELFTLGLDETATAKITDISDNDICDESGASMTLTVEFTGDGPWDLVYAINGNPQPKLNNLSSPAYIIFDYSQLYGINGVGTYTISLLEVYDNNNQPGITLSGDAELEVLETPNPVITGPNRVIVNSEVSFTVPSINENTYSWSISGAASTGATTSGASTATFSVQWGSTTGFATITLTQTNDVTGCRRTITKTVEVINWPVIVGPTDVCAGATVSYHTNAQPGHSYLWEVTDGTIQSGQNTSIVSVTWSNSSSGSIKLTQGPSGSTESITETITIHVAPLTRNLITHPICENSSTQIVVESSQSGTFYQLELASNNTNIGAPVTGNGTNITLPTNVLTTNTPFNVVAYNPGCEITMNTEIIVRPNNGEFYWSGAQNTNWFNTNNWACGGTPSTTSDVVITDAAIYNPQIPLNGTNAFAHSIIVGADASLSMADNAVLNIYGNISITGSFVPNMGSVSLEGSATQSISSSNTLSFYNLGTNNSSGINAAQDIHVENQLSLNGLINMTAGKYLRIGTESRNGNIIRTSGHINGELQRWISGLSSFDMPVGTGNYFREVKIRFTEDPTPGILSVIFDTNLPFGDQFYSNMPITDGGLIVDNISDNGVWHVNPVVGLNNGALYNISFKTQGIDGITVPEGLRMLKRPSNGSGGWVVPGTHGGVNTINAGDSNYEVSRTGVSGFSVYGLGGSFAQNPLPIELLFFDARLNGNIVELSWSTASEINNDYFTIERSIDGINFSPVSIIPSKAINGHSTEQLNYSCNDLNPENGINYYRLKQTDFDGKFEYSEIISINLNQLIDNSFNVYPNPNNGQRIAVSANGFVPNENVKLCIVDLLGKTVYIEMLQANETGEIQSWIIPDMNLPKGVLLIQITGKSESMSKRIIIE